MNNMVSEPIHSVDEFLSTLKVGDTFWCVGSHHNKPSGVNGPYTISAFLGEEVVSGVLDGRELTFGPFVMTETPRENPLRPGEDITIEQSIVDLTNEWHGVFTSREAAEACYVERLAAFESDPDAIRRYEEEVDFNRRLSEWENDYYMQVDTDPLA